MEPKFDVTEMHQATGFPPEKLGQYLLSKIDRLAKEPTTIAAIRQVEMRRARLGSQWRELPSKTSAHDLEQSRWGLVVARDSAAQIQRSLAELIERRRRQMGDDPPIYTVPPAVDAEKFLNEHGQGVGLIDPQRLPYYLLIAASPEDIAFDFQFRLSLSRAVGRIHFSTATGQPDFEAYRDYARSVCLAESERLRMPKKSVFFSSEGADNSKADPIITSLALELPERSSGWTHRLERGATADRSSLQRLLQEDGIPALFMVSAPHPLEGADPSADLAGSPDLLGLIAFMFQPFGAGKLSLDDSPSFHDTDACEVEHRAGRMPSDRPALASLAQELLRRGALATVGWVDRGLAEPRSWPYQPTAVNAVDVVIDSVAMLLGGERIGHAMRPLHRRHLQLAARLGELLNHQPQGQDIDLYELGVLWLSLQSLRNVVVIGDPAVYARGKSDSGADRRPSDAREQNPMYGLDPIPPHGSRVTNALVNRIRDEELI